VPCGIFLEIDAAGCQILGFTVEPGASLGQSAAAVAVDQADVGQQQRIARHRRDATGPEARAREPIDEILGAFGCDLWTFVGVLRGLDQAVPVADEVGGLLEFEWTQVQLEEVGVEADVVGVAGVAAGDGEGAGRVVGERGLDPVARPFAEFARHFVEAIDEVQQMTAFVHQPVREVGIEGRTLRQGACEQHGEVGVEVGRSEFAQRHLTGEERAAEFALPAETLPGIACSRM
jgi:hypothetical protein